MVIVRISDRRLDVAVGERLAFGRDPGPGQITSDDVAVSGRHGVITATPTGWDLESTGSVHSFAVHDCQTPSRLVIPRGAGPISVPFAEAVVVVDVQYRHYAIGVSSCGAPGWSGGLTSLRHGPVVGDAGTQAAWSARFVDRAGRPLRWYQVLVAMCEPRLRLPAELREERIPSNREIAQLLGISQHVLENHHAERLRRELGFPSYTDNMRQAAVFVAISQGLVTPADLAVLGLPVVGDEPGTELDLTSAQVPDSLPEGPPPAAVVGGVAVAAARQVAIQGSGAVRVGANGPDADGEAGRNG